MTDPSDFIATEPASNGRWRVWVWTIDGERRPVGPTFERGVAEAMVENIRAAFSTWVNP